jgi:enoyl-CoA hydratase/carnithine racemase
VASPRSRFGCPEVGIGLSISNGFSLLAPRAARRLVLTGEIVGAEEALRLGLVDVLADDAEREARRLAERIAALAPLAVAGSKRLLDEAGRDALERALDREAALCEQLFETADAREGLAAFLEKREPRFEGR